MPILPVMVQTQKMQRDGITIYYPEVILMNPHIQQRMNHLIFKHVQLLINQQYEQQGTDQFAEMIGTFELKTNERNVFSLTLSNYAIAENFAHGLTLMTSLTFDVTTGKTFRLQDLFKEDADYISVLSEIIKKQIEKRGIPVINSLTSISPEQSFYIADQTLVIYFQAYDITPGYIGIPTFPIPIFRLEQLIPEDGILDRMIAQ